MSSWLNITQLYNQTLKRNSGEDEQSSRTASFESDLDETEVGHRFTEKFVEKRCRILRNEPFGNGWLFGRWKLINKPGVLAGWDGVVSSFLGKEFVFMEKKTGIFLTLRNLGSFVVFGMFLGVLVMHCGIQKNLPNVTRRLSKMKIPSVFHHLYSILYILELHSQTSIEHKFLDHNFTEQNYGTNLLIARVSCIYPPCFRG